MKDLRQIALANQLRYNLPISEIRNWFLTREIPIMSEIWIYPNYPDGYYAACCAWNRTWIFESHKGKLKLYDIQHVQGFRPNGTIIFKWRKK